MITKIIKLPKAERYTMFGISLDHFHECQECDDHSEPEDCTELARDCVDLECYACS